MKRVFFVDIEPKKDTFTSPVYLSQVLRPLALLDKSMFSATVITSTEKTVLLPIKERDGLVVEFVPSKGIFSKIVRSFFALWKALNKQPSTPVIIYTRTIYAGLVAFPFSFKKNVSYIYDRRGCLVSEAQYKGTNATRVRILKSLENLVMSRMACGLGVTNSLSHGLGQFGSNDTWVVPSCAPALVEGDFVHPDVISLSSKGLPICVYAGGGASYQMIDQMFKCWNLMASEIQCGFLILTTAGITIPKQFRHLKIAETSGNLRILELSHSQVVPALSQCDVGFMLREDNLVNQNASPIKFAEYMSAGVPVVTGRNVGDISEEIDASEIGMLMDVENLDEWHQKLVNFLLDVHGNRVFYRERCLSIFRQKYSVDCQLSFWQEIFSRY